MPNAKGKVEVVYLVRRIVRNADCSIDGAIDEIEKEVFGDVAKTLVRDNCCVHTIRAKKKQAK
jgi:hypothetical protein